MSIEIETVRRIALLARVAVDDEQLPGLARELSGILGWVEQLREVDTEGVAPMLTVADAVAARREDAVADGGRAAAILANAPQRIDEYFAVPKVVE